MWSRGRHLLLQKGSAHTHFCEHTHTTRTTNTKHVMEARIPGAHPGASVKEKKKRKNTPSTCKACSAQRRCQPCSACNHHHGASQDEIGRHVESRRFTARTFAPHRSVCTLATHICISSLRGIAAASQRDHVFHISVRLTEAAVSSGTHPMYEKARQRSHAATMNANRIHSLKIKSPTFCCHCFSFTPTHLVHRNSKYYMNFN